MPATPQPHANFNSHTLNPDNKPMKQLLNKIRQCIVCQAYLPAGCNPVVQLSTTSGIIIIGQAPGKRVHETGIPWNDPSGNTLRKWMNVDQSTFYDPAFISVMSMSFCYPGKGKSGDLAPRPECAPLWHDQIIQQFRNNPLFLLVGQYAQHYYLKGNAGNSLTENVRNYNHFLPTYFPLPHPSPRNQNWIKTHPWFINEVIPHLQTLVAEKLTRHQNLFLSGSGSFYPDRGA